VAEQLGFVTTLELDFAKDTPDPARVFRAMSGLIDAFVQLDRDLAHSVAANIEPLVLLEGIEAGSIKAVLRTLLTSLDDEALHTLDWKPPVGQFLVRAKHALLNRLRETDTIETKERLHSIQQDIQLIAVETNVINVHLYEPIPPHSLFADLERLGASLSNLQPTDDAKYISSGGETTLNRDFRLSADQVESLLTDQITAQTTELILKIKKPDYLGSSMWDFYHEGRPFQAKMVDECWLKEFQTRCKDVRPGDSLRAEVRTEIKTTAEGAMVAVRHFVMHVIEVIQTDEGPQGDLFPSEAA
jgi:hypothetical protein